MEVSYFHFKNSPLIMRRFKHDILKQNLPSHSITLETFLATKIMRLTEWENYTLHGA